ncbi:Hypothetical Protein FCC1311_096772 [Hondaea fermentalgiana]|uniref:Uncharacterized protein n=1 Tax=Hondaea fermentalgiana TaxID=2315210 RepID=A0A2R5GZI7_9STRA|nr:Hypothetical Protein FCC1311_096772 [Hondaea fermentalgiana]|eukprot:GBG33454.1 Hypothetical Protein FCC1311_096772 [Hondaea fermentalgiana]
MTVTCSDRGDPAWVPASRESDARTERHVASGGSGGDDADDSGSSSGNGEANGEVAARRDESAVAVVGNNAVDDLAENNQLFRGPHAAAARAAETYIVGRVVENGGHGVSSDELENEVYLMLADGPVRAINSVGGLERFCILSEKLFCKEKSILLHEVYAKRFARALGTRVAEASEGSQGASRSSPAAPARRRSSLGAGPSSTRELTPTAAQTRGATGVSAAASGITWGAQTSEYDDPPAAEVQRALRSALLDLGGTRVRLISLDAAVGWTAHYASSCGPLETYLRTRPGSFLVERNAVSLVKRSQDQDTQAARLGRHQHQEQQPHQHQHQQQRRLQSEKFDAKDPGNENLEDNADNDDDEDNENEDEEDQGVHDNNADETDGGRDGGRRAFVDPRHEERGRGAWRERAASRLGKTRAQRAVILESGTARTLGEAAVQAAALSPSRSLSPRGAYSSMSSSYPRPSRSGTAAGPTTLRTATATLVMSDEEILARARAKVRVAEDARQEVARCKRERAVLLEGKCPANIDSNELDKVLVADNAALAAFVEARRVDLENICGSASKCASSLRDQDAVTWVLFKDVQVESGRLHQAESSLESAQHALEELQAQEAALTASLAALEENCEEALATRCSVRENMSKLQDGLEMRSAAHAQRMAEAGAKLSQLEAQERALLQRAADRIEVIASAEIDRIVDERVEEEREHVSSVMAQVRAKHRADFVRREADTRRSLEERAKATIESAGARAARDGKLLKRELARLRAEAAAESEAAQRARDAADARKFLRAAVKSGTHLQAVVDGDRASEAEVARARDSLRQLLEDHPELAALMTTNVSAQVARDPARRNQSVAQALEAFVRKLVLPHVVLPNADMVEAYATTLRQVRLVLTSTE